MPRLPAAPGDPFPQSSSEPEREEGTAWGQVCFTETMRHSGSQRAVPFPSLRLIFGILLYEGFLPTDLSYLLIHSCIALHVDSWYFFLFSVL